MSGTLPNVPPFDKAYSLPCPPDRVFWMLTEAASLRRWFSEHAEVEAHIGGAYRFWGRHTFWLGLPEEADGRITAIAAPTLLEFAFTWHGAPCTVRIDLTADGAGTRLRIRQTFQGSWREFQGEQHWVMLDFWDVAIGNLRALVRTGRPTILPDYVPKGDQVRQSVEIDAPPERVFAALTVPEEMNKWISTAARCEARRGGEYAYGWPLEKDGKPVHCGPTHLIEIVTDRLVAHDWRYNDEPVTRVEWALEPLDGGRRTRVTLTHHRFAGDTQRDGYVQGWAKFLVSLREYGEIGRAESAPMPDRP